MALIKSVNLFRVVGIGASAGGLEAFKSLLKAIPENSGIAYILVQHLDPNHESLLPEILQKVTNIPVVEITDDMKVEPDRIYVIPSNKMMVATDGVLLLRPRPARSKTERNLPIDLFFTSLAEVHEHQAIGVVLTGTGSDGTLGLKAIKEVGGITFAQDEASAAYSGMPGSAVQAGVVDFVLPPGKIPQKLLEVMGVMDQNGQDLNALPLPDDEVFKQILSLLRIRKGTDFTYYKQTTIRRRILRRMAISKNEQATGYLQYLRENKTEQDTLFQDLLIPVTSFFRDQKTFDHLRETFLPIIVKNKMPGEALRLWVAGCSTGQEAYSMAICLRQFFGSGLDRVQIFGTDLSEPAIAKARAGIYSQKELSNVTQEQLNAFFTKNNDGYRINKEVRDMCVFAQHNFLKDPPFGKMDFISCRNVLIYMEHHLQKKALTTFHYSLNLNGFLLLGKSETIGSVPDLFVQVSKNEKMFGRRDVPGGFIHLAAQQRETNVSRMHPLPEKDVIRTDFQKTADEMMLSKYTPPGVVVNHAMDVVHFRGNTSHYLEQASGKPTHNLLLLAKYGLAFELRSILHKVKKEKRIVIKQHIPVQLDGGLRNISIEAVPLPNTIEPHYLVLFHDQLPFSDHVDPATKNSTRPKAMDAGQSLRIAQLERELAQNREDMRSITEDQEAINEELQRANEELLSGSEELQSLNEELETGKEELQSTNEELTVVNHEISTLNEQVSEARDYAEAIIANIHEPLIILNKNLRVISANRSFYRNFRVTEEETKGLLLYDLGNRQWNIPRLRELLEDIIPKNSQFHDFEIAHNFEGIGEKIMLLNASRIVQKSRGEQLILLAIHDVSELRMKAFELQQKEEELLQKDKNERNEEKLRLEAAIRERTGELELANSKLVFQNAEKQKRAEELFVANEELVFQNTEKGKRAAELALANEELVFQNEEKGKRAAELALANKELVFQNEEKGKRAAELALANEELVFQNEEKEKRAGELVLANKELVFQNEEKEKRAIELVSANKELLVFTYISSHDLQEPLRKIQILGGLILEKEAANLTDKGKDYLTRMRNAAKRMQILIQDLLAFSRLDSTERRFTDTDLGEIIEDMKNSFRDLIEEKHAVIESPDLCDVYIIPLQFRQLMYNLFSNAFKFSNPDLAVRISIRSVNIKYSKTDGEFHPLRQDYCHISFQDNGIGFAPEHQDRIFEVFQRLHGKEKYPGTGMGLAIVKKIVETHNGVITASGRVGQGATFDIYIPTS